MFAALRAETRKLLSVRSTYVVVAGMILLTLFFAGYVDGFKGDAKIFKNPGDLALEVVNALNFTGVFCGLVAIMLFSHEYRYNTILHTLTSINRRSKVLLAKIVVMSGFAIVFALLVGVLSPLANYVGVHVAGHHLVAQTIPVSDLLWRGLFYTWGYAMAGLLFVALTRNQVFSIVGLFFFPLTIEGIATLLLKHNAIYLPFTSLNAVLSGNPDTTHRKAALVFLIWLAVAWLIAWLLFLRRDATNNRS